MYTINQHLEFRMQVRFPWFECIFLLQCFSQIFRNSLDWTTFRHSQWRLFTGYDWTLVRVNAFCFFVFLVFFMCVLCDCRSIFGLVYLCDSIFTHWAWKITFQKEENVNCGIWRHWTVESAHYNVNTIHLIQFNGFGYCYDTQKNALMIAFFADGRSKNAR